MSGWGTLLLILAQFTSTFSQDQNSPAQPDSVMGLERPKYILEEVVVTAPRVERQVLDIPYAVAVLDQAKIQRAEAGLSLEEALRVVPGVLVNNRHNLSQGDRISIRGLGSQASFGVRGVKIFLDNIPLTLADGQSQLNNLDLGAIGSIEVLRGPSSSLYGNAAAGLVRITSEAPATNAWLFQPRVIVGSHGLQKWQGRFSGTRGSHAYYLHATRLTFDGFREHADAKSTALNAISHHVFSAVKLSTVLNYYDAPYLLNPSSLSKADAGASPRHARSFVVSQGASKKVRQGQGGLTINFRSEDNSEAEITVYGLGRNLLNPIPGRIIELDRWGGGIRSLYAKRFGQQSRTARLAFGVDLELQRDERVEFANEGLPQDQTTELHNEDIFDQLEYGTKLLDQKETVWGIGPFAELEFSVTPTLAATIGVRYDRFRFKVVDRFFEDGVSDSGSRTMDQISPVLGLNYRPKPQYAIYTNVATAFQTPTTTELSNRPEGEGGFNPSLQPVKLTSFELGSKGFWPQQNLQFQAALFQANLRNILIPFQVQDAQSEEIFFRNAGRARNRGLELNLIWVPLGELEASIAYTLMNFVFTDYRVQTNTEGTEGFTQLSDNEVPGVPTQHLSLGLTYEHPVGVYFEGNLQWTDEYFTNDFNGPGPGSNKPLAEFVNDAFVLVDLRLGTQKRVGSWHLDWFLGINNLFDVRYNGSIVPNAFRDRFFEPAAGRNWYSGVSVTVAE